MTTSLSGLQNRMRSGVQGQTSEETFFPGHYYTSILSNGDSQVVTVTVTEGASTATSGASPITTAPSSSSMAIVYIYPTSITDDSSPTSLPPSSSNQVSGLSPGVIASIVIGSLAFLITLTLIVFCASRRFAKRKRRETSLYTTKASREPSYQHQHMSVRPRDSPHELATQYNELEMVGRGRPYEMVGSYLHPVELQAGSTTDLPTHVWKKPPDGGYLKPGGQEEEANSDRGGSGEYFNPGAWETMSSGGESGNTQARLSTTTLQASSSDHSH